MRRSPKSPELPKSKSRLESFENKKLDLVKKSDLKTESEKMESRLGGKITRSEEHP